MAMLDTAILVMEREIEFAQGLRQGHEEGRLLEADARGFASTSWPSCPRSPPASTACASRRARASPRRRASTGPSNYAHMLGIPDKSGEFADLHAPLPGPAQRPRGRQRLGAHLPLCRLGALRSLLRRLGRPQRPGGPAARPGQPGVPGLDPRGDSRSSRACPPTRSCASSPGIRSTPARSSPATATPCCASPTRASTPSAPSARKHLPEDPVLQLVDKVFKIVPEVLVEQGKAKDPWPNVDAATGALLYHYGLQASSRTTRCCSRSRAPWACCSQLIVNRAMGTPIERPKS